MEGVFGSAARVEFSYSRLLKPYPGYTNSITKSPSTSMTQPCWEANRLGKAFGLSISRTKIPRRRGNTHTAGGSDQNFDKLEAGGLLCGKTKAVLYWNSLRGNGFAQMGFWIEMKMDDLYSWENWLLGVSKTNFAETTPRTSRQGNRLLIPWELRKSLGKLSGKN